MTNWRKRVRWRAEAAFAWTLFTLFRILPVDWASALGGALMRGVGPWLQVSRVARRNLVRAFPHMSAAEVEAVLVRVWDNLGRIAGEFPHLDWLIHNRVEVVDIEHLHAMRDDGRPGVFVSAHFGNWEMAGAIACREGLPISLIYRAANNPYVEGIFRRGRAAAAQGGQISKGAQGAREALQVLRQGGHLGMLVDQKMSDGIAVPFFGRDAMTAPAVARFAQKFGCPVVPARVERLGGAHFRISFSPPMTVPETGDSHRDIVDFMKEVNALIESWVRADPGQWLWLHKRWPD
jgi:Kdo2-lipid IVA lauroyltransferase/acyltransferase